MRLTAVTVSLRIASLALLCGLLLAAWKWQPWTGDVDQFAAWFATHRLLSLGAFVVGVAGFGYQLRETLRNPAPRTLGAAAIFVVVPLTLALLINHALHRLRTASPAHSQGTA